MDIISSTAATRVTYAGTGALRNGTEFGTVTDTAPVSPDGDVVPGLIEV
ncbi:MAG: hypothetical protein H7290_02380, partial [Flavobacterium sp.]|nr:hypothetical protein [Aeromicrobium sp.]